MSVLSWGSSLVVGVCAFAASASCETVVTPGNVSGNWTIQGSPYVISGGNVTVPDGQRLKIEAGVRVEFKSHHKFVVQGHLSAQGFPADSIVFSYTGPDSLPGWRGFRLLSADSVRFAYCRFEHGSAIYGSGSDSTGGVVFMNGGSVVEFRHCEFQKNYAGSSGGAIYAGSGTAAKCYDCVFIRNRAKGDGGAVFANSAHGSEFERCEFVENVSEKGGGAIFNRYANASYIDCYVHHNVARSSGGSLVVTGPPSFRRCVFESNVTQIAQGGGAYIYDSTTTATFDSCAFRYNRSLLRDGGGVYCWESPPRFTDCQFIGNYSSDDGGGVHAYRSGANPVFLRCLFEYNESSDDGGGLIISRYSKAVLTDCVIRNNTASGRGGGGIYFQLLCEPVITNCVIENNTSNFGGGGLHINTGSPTLRDCAIRGNVTDSTGGGLYAEGATFLMERCTISGNRAVDHGGGVALWISSPMLSQCRIEGNHADSLGGGVYLLDSQPQLSNCLIAENEAVFRGGALYADHSFPELRHCTIVQGRSPNGHMLYSEQSSGLLSACVLDNTLPTSANGEPPAGLGMQFNGQGWQIHNSLLHALGIPEYNGVLPVGFGTLAGVTAAGDSCDGYGNVFMSPEFADTAPDPYSFREVGAASPAIDAAPSGSLLVDVAGCPRNSVETDLPDMGCYESSRRSQTIGLWGVQTGQLDSGIYDVYGDLVVPFGEKLVLTAGAELHFAGPFAILVYGSLEARGTVQDSVRLTADLTANLRGWRGVRLAGTDSITTLAHTVIEGCRVESSDSSGGAIGIFGGSVELVDCAIRRCVSSGNGGGVRVVSGSLLARRSIFEECDGLSGGAVFLGQDQSAQLDSCEIRLCSAGAGGGISVESGTVSLLNVRFEGNSAQDGGAIYLRNSAASVSGTSVADNSSSSSGGGVYLVGSTLSADSVTLTGNSSQVGGGLYGYNSTVNASQTSLESNVGVEEGGGLFFDQCTGHIERGVFSENESGRGAGMFLVHDSTHFSRCTIDANTGIEGSGVYLEDSHTRLTTSQVTNNDYGFYFANSPASVVEYNNVFGNRFADFIHLSGDSSHGPAGLGVIGPRNRLGFRCDVYYNMHEDPGYETPGEGNYQLVIGSPCLDAGSPAEPCDDDLTFPDIGAFHTPTGANTDSYGSDERYGRERRNAIDLATTKRRAVV
ncbi:MAG: right-handed parallel beta-helix repeat-containing protein [bacterium]|nr:right-handed parallel beta-helix repeat-containing protein [bacterium]